MNIQVFKKAIYPVQGRLFRVAKLMLNNQEEAEDTVQETLLKLWLNRHNLNNYRSIEALAIVITKNLCLDKLKSLRWKHVNTEDLSKANPIVLNPHQIAEQSDSHNVVLELMQKLPEQ